MPRRNKKKIRRGGKSREEILAKRRCSLSSWVGEVRFNVEQGRASHRALRDRIDSDLEQSRNDREGIKLAWLKKDES